MAQATVMPDVVELAKLLQLVVAFDLVLSIVVDVVIFGNPASATVHTQL